MIKSLWIPVVALMVVAAPAAAPAFADPGPGGEGMHQAHADRHMNRMFDRLNLTADQKSRLQAAKTRQRDAHKAQREALGKKWQELSALMRSASATKDQAIAKQREINQIHAQLAEARVAAWFEMRAILTPEQLKQLETLKQERGRRGGGKHH